MVVSLSVTVDKSDIRNLDRAVARFPRLVSRESNRAVQRTTKKTETIVVDRISKASHIKKKDLRTPMQTTSAGVSFVFNRSDSEPSGRVLIRSRPFTLSRFLKPKTQSVESGRTRLGRRRGVRILVYKDGGTKIVAGAFMAYGRGGVPQIFKRETSWRGSAVVLRTASALSMARRSPGGIKAIENESSLFFEKELGRRIDRLLRQS